MATIPIRALNNTDIVKLVTAGKLYVGDLQLEYDGNEDELMEELEEKLNGGDEEEGDDEEENGDEEEDFDLDDDEDLDEDDEDLEEEGEDEDE